MATAAAPVSARKPFVWWSLTFAPYLQELRDAAKDGKGPDRAPLKKKVFNGRFFKVNVARQAIAALFDSKALSEVALEFEIPTAGEDSLAQCFDQDTAQQVAGA
jgi:hypothetical protein